MFARCRILRENSKLLLLAILLCLGGWTGCGSNLSTSLEHAVRLGTLQDKDLQEVSGLAASRRSPGILWIHNDGSKARVYALETNAQLVAAFKLDAPVDDLEDIAIGPGRSSGQSYIYLGDIGDNLQSRPYVRVIRFAEPALDREKRAKKAVEIRETEVFELHYPKGRPDAEALMVDPLTGDLYIATKERRSSQLYRVASEDLKTNGKVFLIWVCEVPLSQVSAADISPDGRMIILRNERTALLWKRPPGGTIRQAMVSAAAELPVLGPPREPNGEAVGFHPDSRGYYTISEGSRQPLYFFPQP